MMSAFESRVHLIHQCGGVRRSIRFAEIRHIGAGCGIRGPWVLRGYAIRTITALFTAQTLAQHLDGRVAGGMLLAKWRR